MATINEIMENKELLTKIIVTADKLDKVSQARILGISEGMALMIEQKNKESEVAV